MSQKNSFRHIIVPLVLVSVIIGLIFAVPLAINWCYYLHPIIYTKWGAADVLNFYGSLLGTTVAAITFVLTIRFTLMQIKHEQEIRCERELWQNIEQSIDMCLDEMHPKALELVVINALSERNAYKLITGTLTYRVSVTTSVDRMSRSIDRLNDPELKALREEINKIRDKLLDIESQFELSRQEVMLDGLRNSFQPDKDRTRQNLLEFAEKRRRLEDILQKVYMEDYLDLVLAKNDLFRKKYREISKRMPT